MTFYVSTQKGFTLIEMLLSVVLISVIAGIGIPIYYSFQQRNELDVTAQVIAQTLRSAQLHARAMDGTDGWGVYVTTGTITLYKGTNYATRADSQDTNTSFTSAIMVSGLQDINFTPLLGEVQTTGTLILTSKANENRQISINEKGTVSQ